MRIAALIATATALVASLLAVFFTSDVVPLPHNTERSVPRLAGKVLVIVIDGLRYDTALETDLMPTVRALAARGTFGLSLATEVTMTENGVRTLGTGATPSLVDYLWPKGRAQLDSPLDALGDAGGRFGLIGTGTWKRQFGRAARIVVTDDAHRCLHNLLGNCPDSVYVDEALSVLTSDKWDLLVVHLPGIDSASHRYTAFTAPFRDKAREVDSLIAKMVAAAGDDATVIVTSDHGSGDSGHHGSGEWDARRTPIVLFGPGVRAHGQIAIAQNDFAPTLSILLGVPIPSSSEGVVALDALELAPDQREQVIAANRAQLTRYVAAFATLRKVAVPQIPRDDLRAASRFLQKVRARSSNVPFLWAAALVLGAVVLVLSRGERPLARAQLAWGLLVLDAASAAAFDPRSVPLALLGLAIAIVGVGLDARAPLPRPLQRLVVLLTATGLLEVLIGVWRLNRRESQIAVIKLGARINAEEDATFALFVVAIAVVAVIALRWRARAIDNGPWITLVAMIAATAAGDTLALPVGIGAGIVVALVAADSRALPNLLLVLAAGAVALGVERYHAPELPWLGALGPLCAGGLALVATRTTSKMAWATIAVLAIAATVVRALGAPATPYAIVLVAGGLGVVGVPLFATSSERMELLGWMSLVLVTFLCQPIQIPGVLVVGLAAREAAQFLRTDDRDVRIFRGIFFVIAARLALLAVFEQTFSFSRLEIWLAFMGNESGERFAFVVILLKLTLAFLVAVALVTAELAIDTEDVRRILNGCAAFLLLRVGHIVLSMTIARGTYYSPNADAGPLLFNLFMAGSLLLVAAVIALHRNLRPTL